MPSTARRQAALYHARKRRRGRAAGGGGSAPVPVIVNTAPTNRTEGVAITGTVSVAFNIPVRLSTGNIVLRDVTNGTDAEVFDVAQGTGGNGGTVSANTFIVSLIPGNNLLPQTVYAVLIDHSAVVAASSGVSFGGIAAETELSFTTQALSVPAITGSVPADNETDVALASDIVITFNENLSAETGNVVLRRLDGPVVVETFNVADGSGSAGGSVSLLGNAITVTPGSDLVAGAGYAVQIEATCYRGLISGQLFPGIANDTELNFAAIASPQLTSSVPDDDATGIALDAAIVLNFDQPVEAGTGSVALRDLSGPTVVETFDVTTGLGTAGGSIGFAGAAATVTPGASLAANADYAVQVDASAIENASGLSFEGISDDVRLNFSTVSAAAPQLVSSMPDDGDTGILPGATIVLEFDVNVQPGSGLISLRELGGPSVVESFDVASGLGSGGGAIAFSGTDVTLTPGAAMLNDTAYAVQVAATAVEETVAGVPFAGIADDTTLDFRILSTAPAFVASVPDDDATGIDVGSDIVLTFDKDVVGGTGNVIVQEIGVGPVETFAADTGTGSGGGTLVFSGADMTIDPAAPLDSGKAYSIRIDPTAVKEPVDDLTFTGISDDLTLNFTTAAAGGAWDPVVDGGAILHVDRSVTETAGTAVNVTDEVSGRTFTQVASDPLPSGNGVVFPGTSITGYSTDGTQSAGYEGAATTSHADYILYALCAPNTPIDAALEVLFGFGADGFDMNASAAGFVTQTTLAIAARTGTGGMINTPNAAVSGTAPRIITVAVRGAGGPTPTRVLRIDGDTTPAFAANTDSLPLNLQSGVMARRRFNNNSRNSDFTFWAFGAIPLATDARIDEIEGYLNNFGGVDSGIITDTNHPYIDAPPTGSSPGAGLAPALLRGVDGVARFNPPMLLNRINQSNDNWNTNVGTGAVEHAKIVKAGNLDANNFPTAMGVFSSLRGVRHVVHGRRPTTPACAWAAHRPAHEPMCSSGRRPATR